MGGGKGRGHGREVLGGGYDGPMVRGAWVKGYHAASRTVRVTAGHAHCRQGQGQGQGQAIYDALLQVLAGEPRRDHGAGAELGLEAPAVDLLLQVLDPRGLQRQAEPEP